MGGTLNKKGKYKKYGKHTSNKIVFWKRKGILPQENGLQNKNFWTAALHSGIQWHIVVNMKMEDWFM